MTAKSKLFIVFGTVFCGMFLFIVAFAFFSFFIAPQWGAKKSAELNKKRTAETSGTVLTVSKYTSSRSKTGGGFTSYTFEYEYAVNGVKYKASQQRSWEEKENEKQQRPKVKVCYDPSDPNSSEFYYTEDNKTCGK